MRKKSKWVICRDAVFNVLKSLFTRVVGFIRSDKELRNIFKLAGKEIIVKIKALENNADIPGAEKLVAVRAIAIDVLKKNRMIASKHLINTAIEMLLLFVRGR